MYNPFDPPPPPAHRYLHIALHAWRKRRGGGGDEHIIKPPPFCCQYHQPPPPLFSPHTPGGETLGFFEAKKIRDINCHPHPRVVFFVALNEGLFEDAYNPLFGLNEKMQEYIPSPSKKPPFL